MPDQHPFPGWDFRSGPLEEEELDDVVRHLRSGGLIAYPTETVYGFGCALRADALARLRALKRRSGVRPFLLLVPDREAVQDLRWTAEARELADVFWPGSLTLVLADPGERYPGEVRGPSGGVAVRVSPDPVARALVERLGAPLTSTSANEPGEAPASTAPEAAGAAGALGAGDEMGIVDGGRREPSPPSTIVDLTGETPRVLREGAVPVKRLAFIR